MFQARMILFGQQVRDITLEGSCIKPVFTHTNIYWIKNFRLLLSFRYHSTFETFKQIVWNVICMRLRNPLLKQLYLWVICYHYSYQKITVQIRGLGHWYFHLICQGFFCSVRYCSSYLTYRAIKIWWDVSPMPIWCTITISIIWVNSYFTWVIWLLYLLEF